MIAADYRFDDYRLVVSARELWHDGTLVVLPRRVFDCLLYLIDHRDRAVGRDELAAAVWGRADVSDGQVGQLVMRVRRALGDDGQTQTLIRTLPGFGYRWILPLAHDVQPVEEALSTSTRVGPVADIHAPADDGGRQPHNGAADTATAARDSRRRHRLSRAAGVLIVIALAAVIALAIGWYRHDAPESQRSDGSVIVLPVDVDQTHADAGWIRLGVMDLIADRMRDAGLPVPQSDHTLALLARLPTARAPATAQSRLDDLPEAAGVVRVIQVVAARKADRWQIVLAAASHGGAQHRQTGEDTDVLRATRIATDRLLASLGYAPRTEALVDPALDERLRRAQAAMLANELDTARRILTEDGPIDLTHPEIRYRLAQIDFRAGRLDVASRELDALIEGAGRADDPLLLSRALRSRGSLNIRRSRDVDAERDFDAAASLSANRTAPAELGWALNGRAVARLILGRVDAAAADLGRARIHLQQAGEIHGVLSVDNNLGLIELTRLRPAQAIMYSDAAARQFEAIGAVNEALSAHSVVIDAHLSQLQWLDALAVSDRGWSLRDRVDDPDVRLALTLNRSRILLGLGRHREVATLLDDIDARYPAISQWNRIDLEETLAEFAAAQGRADAVIEHAQRALRARPADDGDANLARVALLLGRARQWADGAVLGERAVTGTPSARSTAWPFPALEQAELLSARRHDDASDDAYLAAVAAAESRGLPAEIALVADSYGRWLLRHDRIEDATGVIGRVAPYAQHDFDCALLQVILHHRRGEIVAWSSALDRARKLSGERTIADEWQIPPSEPNHDS